mgnify:CR=1 FL=1
MEIKWQSHIAVVGNTLTCSTLHFEQCSGSTRYIFKWRYEALPLQRYRFNYTDLIIDIMFTN